MSTNRVTVGGNSGEVRWGYHTAATVGPWTVIADQKGHALTATVVSHDAFKVSQRPLTFVVSRPKGQWVWSINTLQMADGTLTASLVPQE